MTPPDRSGAGRGYHAVVGYSRASSNDGSLVLEVKDFNEKESIMTVSAEMLRTYLLIVAVLAIREGIEAWRGDVESLFEVLEDLEDDDDDAEEKIR